MSSELDRILELVNARDVAEARARLERLDPESVAGEELGRLRALQTACLLLDGEGRAAQDRLASWLAEHGADLEFLRGFDATFSSCARVSKPSVQLRIGRRIARCEEERGDPEAAAETYRQLLREHPEQQALWRDVARNERRANDPEAAASAMQRYLKSQPDDAAAWASLGDFLDDAGSPEEAETAWQRALELGPDDPTLYYNRGVAAGRRKDLERVRACADALQRRDPEDPLALALSSILLEAEGETWRGWEAMRQAVDRETDRSRALALSHRALLYAERNELREPARKLIDLLHERNLLDDDVLEAANRIENRGSKEAHDYSVLVDVVPDPKRLTVDSAAEDAPEMRLLRWMRVVADSPDEAAHLATAFERRCGALEVRVDEVSDKGALQEPDHVGVWRVQDEPDYYPREWSEGV